MLCRCMLQVLLIRKKYKLLYCTYRRINSITINNLIVITIMKQYQQLLRIMHIKHYVRKIRDKHGISHNAIRGTITKQKEGQNYDIT